MRLTRGVALRIVSWAALTIASLGTSQVAAMLHLPAAQMFGPLCVSMAFALVGIRLSLPGFFGQVAQAIIGAMVANSLTLATWQAVYPHLAMLIFVCLAIPVISFGIGAVVMRRGKLPGSTAIWGAAPSAASAMILLAEQNGSDPRIVGVMHYLRILLVAVCAIGFATIAGGHHPTAPVVRGIEYHELDATVRSILFILGCAVLGRHIKFSGATILLASFGGAFLVNLGLIDLYYPPLVPAVGYGLIGWIIGFHFDRKSMMIVGRLLPYMILTTLALIGGCAVLGVVLAMGTGLDSLSAYLATSPGGIDSVFAIATSTRVDLQFIVAAQVSRFVVVLLVGPPLARYLEHRWTKPSPVFGEGPQT